MQSGSSGGETEPITAINITPLVDVSLVLVIIFMVTMPFLAEKALAVKASPEQAVKVSAVTEPILVEISDKGVAVEGRSVPIDGLADELSQLIKQRGNSSVAVTAGRAISHGKVVEVLDQVAASGAGELNLLQPEGSDHDAR